MQSPTARDIRSSESSESASGGDDSLTGIEIENIEAVTDQEDANEAESGDSRAIEDEPPTVIGGIAIQVQDQADLEISRRVERVDSSESGSSSDDESSTSSSSTDNSSDKSDISSSSSSESASVYSDSEDSDATSYKYNKKKMSSSMNKSPICDGKRDGFEEWHAKWEVFGQDAGFDEFQSIEEHPNLPEDGHLDMDAVTKQEKKALKKNKKAISSLRISFATTYTVDAMIESTIDDAGKWPYGRIHLVLIGLYDTYRPKSRLDRIQLDRDKLTIKMATGEHPDVLFELAMMVRKKYRRRRTKPTWDELISSVVTGAAATYQNSFITKMLEMDGESNGQVVLTALKQLGNELYTGSALSRTGIESAHETSLVQFKRNSQTDQWTQGQQCYWCWQLGHKMTDCPRRAAGDAKLAKPGSNITPATNGGGGNNNNGGGGGGGGKPKCGKCRGQHTTKSCFHDPKNASKRPKGWIVKTEFGTFAGESNSQLAMVPVGNQQQNQHRPDFSIIAIDSSPAEEGWVTVVKPSGRSLVQTKVRTKMVRTQARTKVVRTQARTNLVYSCNKKHSCAPCGAVDADVTPVTPTAVKHTYSPARYSLGFRAALNNMKPDISLVAAQAPVRTESAIEASLLAIQDQVKRGKMTFPDNFELLYDKNVWIFDTGASCNSSGCMDGATNVTDDKSEVIPANGVHIKQSKVGDIPCVKLDKHGKHVNYTCINRVKFGAQNTFNLFSANNAMEHDWMAFGNRDNGWRIENQAGDCVQFDIRISTETSCIWCGYFQRVYDKKELMAAAPQPLIAQAAPAKSKAIKMSIMKAHEVLGHGDQEKTKATAVALGWTIHRGGWCRCEHCAKAKAKRKNIPKNVPHDGAKKPGGRIFTDITSIRRPKHGSDTLFVSKPHMRILVDEATNIRFIRWFETKDGMVDPTCATLHQWKTKGMETLFIRCDGAGENNSLERTLHSSQWKMPIEFEYTARNTPQQNHLAEIGIYAISCRARALMSRANTPSKYKYRMFWLSTETACVLDWLTVVTIDGVMAMKIKHFADKVPDFVKHLRTFGEAGVVTIAGAIKKKVDMRGILCLMGGYCTERAGDCYKMYDPINNNVYLTRDVLWLNRMYFDQAGEVDNLPDISADSAPAAPVAQTLTPPVPNPVPNPVPSTGLAQRKKSSMKQHTVSFPVLNGENDSMASREKQQASFKTDNDIEFDNDSGTEVDPEAEADDDSSDDELDIIEGTTRSGRSFKNLKSIDKPSYSTEQRGRKDALLAQLSKRLTPAEVHFYNEMKDLRELSLMSAEAPSDEARSLEFGLVGAAGNNYGNTADLNTLNYKQSMDSPYRDKYVEGMDEEQYKMSRNEVFEEVNIEDIPPGTKLLDSTWANKLKADGSTRCRLAIRGFQQIDGVHFDASDKAAPVVCDVTIRVMLILAIMANWLAWIVDVEGAFLQGHFQNGEQIFMKIPNGFQKFYPSYVMLKLLRTLYGLSQSAIQFWRECRMAMDAMNKSRNAVDPCLFYQWVDGQLIVILLWVDDFLILGPDELVPGTKNQLLSLFNCKDVGEMKEYVGCKMDRDRKCGWMRMTQPVKIQKFEDEYDIDIASNRVPSTPAEPGSVLRKEGVDEFDILLSPEDQLRYRSATAVLLHMMRWSRAEIMNAVRDCSRYMQSARESHNKALNRVMRYCVGTPLRGLLLMPTRMWNGEAGFQFIINGLSDSEYAKDDSRHSINGWSTWMFGCCVTHRSKMMPIIALSVTEAELYAAVLCAQDMLFIMRLLFSLGLDVKLPMILEVDNKGAVDFINGWSVSGRTRHIEVKQYFLRELKEQGIIKIIWRSGDEMTSDIFTKNLPPSLFEYHGHKFYGKDEYYYESKNKKNDKKETGFISVECKREYDFYHDVFDDLIG